MTNKEAIDELKKVDTLDMPTRLCEAHYMAIKALEQEPKTGHWKRNETIALTYCSECGFGQRIDEYRTYNYCPNCGARMESEDRYE